jgi:hypothetical protein
VPGSQLSKLVESAHRQLDVFVAIITDSTSLASDVVFSVLTDLCDKLIFFWFGGDRELHSLKLNSLEAGITTLHQILQADCTWTDKSITVKLSHTDKPTRAMKFDPTLSWTWRPQPQLP